MRSFSRQKESLYKPVSRVWRRRQDSAFEQLSRSDLEMVHYLQEVVPPVNSHIYPKENGSLPGHDVPAHARVEYDAPQDAVLLVEPVTEHDAETEESVLQKELWLQPV